MWIFINPQDLLWFKTLTVNSLGQAKLSNKRGYLLSYLDFVHNDIQSKPPAYHIATSKANISFFNGTLFDFCFLIKH